MRRLASGLQGYAQDSLTCKIFLRKLPPYLHFSAMQRAPICLNICIHVNGLVYCQCTAH